MRALVLAVLALLPGIAMASGFYLPWWGEVMLFLLVTPAGWAFLALAATPLIALAALAWKKQRKGK